MILFSSKYSNNPRVPFFLLGSYCLYYFFFSLSYVYYLILIIWHNSELHSYLSASWNRFFFKSYALFIISTWCVFRIRTVLGVPVLWVFATSRLSYLCLALVGSSSSLEFVIFLCILFLDPLFVAAVPKDELSIKRCLHALL